jgi:hypothetical protein
MEHTKGSRDERIVLRILPVQDEGQGRMTESARKTLLRAKVVFRAFLNFCREIIPDNTAEVLDGCREHLGCFERCLG